MSLYKGNKLIAGDGIDGFSPIVSMVEGKDKVTISVTDVNGTKSATLNALECGGTRLPAGVMLTTVSTVIPDGWLLCDGHEVYRSVYPELFRAIGTTYGVGNGTTTFNLPDMKNRVPVGYKEDEEFSLTLHSIVNNSAGYYCVFKSDTLTQEELYVVLTSKYDVGDKIKFTYNYQNIGLYEELEYTISGFSLYSTAGVRITWVEAPVSKYITGALNKNYVSNCRVVKSSLSSVGDVGGEEYHKLTVNEMPAHSHEIKISTFSYGQTATKEGIVTTSGSTTITSNSTGDGLSHNNMQPYLLSNYIIYAGEKVGIEETSETLVLTIPDYVEGVATSEITLIDFNDTRYSADITLITGETIALPIPAGDKYSVSIGEIEGYAKPIKDIAESVASEGVSKELILYYKKEICNVTVTTTYPNSVITYGNDDYQGYSTATTGEGTTGILTLPEGTYKVEVYVDNELVEWSNIIVQAEDTDLTLDLPSRIYGISKNLEETTSDWTRTDDAVGLRAKAFIQEDPQYFNDFDCSTIWSGIKRVTMDTGDLMVKIPAFYYKRERVDNIESIQLSAREHEGFQLHPAFTHNGKQQSYICVGATPITDNYLSEIGVSYNKSTLATHMTNISAKGEGWSFMDLTTVSALQMLIMVEFANTDISTVLGRGSTSTPTIAQPLGEGVPHLTGAVDILIIWRGIYNLWNMVTRIAGAYILNGIITYTNDITKINTSTDSSYITVEGTYVGGSGYAKTMTLNETDSAIMIPTEVVSSIDESIYKDQINLASNATISELTLSHGANAQYGLFTIYRNTTSNKCSRLIYVPNEIEGV